jgi:hypothetical protein
MVAQGKKRASGQTAASEEALEAAREIEQPMESTMPEDERRSKHRTPGFTRMRTDWNTDARAVLSRAQSAVEMRIMANFGDVYRVMNRVYDLVREPEVDMKTGEILTDQYGLTQWRRDEYGGFIEDFTRLTRAQKEDLMFQITTRMFDWEQRAADAWGEAMLAKAAFEEQFAIDFDAPMHGTVDDRRAAGSIGARDERYFAIFVSLYSRKADALVKSMERLGQRLKDSME